MSYYNQSNMGNFFLGTNKTLFDVSVLLLRWITGLILFVAGAGKVFGLFGGYGMEKTVEAFWSMMHINAFWAYVSSYAELIGGFLLIIGFLTRPAAFALWINMLVATILVTRSSGFFGQNGGATFPCTLMITSFVILLTGPMAISLDRLLFNKIQEPRSKIQISSKIQGPNKF
jgi:putative oxidoreductase